MYNFLVITSSWHIDSKQHSPFLYLWAFQREMGTLSSYSICLPLEWLLLFLWRFFCELWSRIFMGFLSFGHFIIAVWPRLYSIIIIIITIHAIRSCEFCTWSFGGGDGLWFFLCITGAFISQSAVSDCRTSDWSSDSSSSSSEWILNHYWCNELLWFVMMMMMIHI